jgi:hypothetical protein
MVFRLGHPQLIGSFRPHVTARPVAERVAAFSPSPTYALPGATCMGMDTELFFPHECDSVGIERARSVCSKCPVAAACLAGAIERREKYGVFGGLTAEERFNMVRRSRRSKGEYVPPSCGTTAGYRRHLRLRQTTCTECRSAVAERDRKRRLRRASIEQVAA